MANVATLSAKMQFDINDFLKKSNVVVLNLREMSTEARKASGGVDGLGSAMNGIGQLAQAAGINIGGLTSAMASGGAAGIAFALALGTVEAAAWAVNKAVQAISFGAQLAAEAETAEVAFSAMLNSADRAKKMMKDLEDFAVNTPFSSASAREGAGMLLANQIPVDEILPTLKTLGDLAQGNEERFSRLALVFGQVRSAGKVMGQDLNQALNANIPIITAIAKEMGVLPGEVRKLGEQGKITFPIFRNALIEIANTQFKDLMDKQSATPEGAMNRIKEVSGGIFKDIAEGLGDAFDVTKIMNELGGFLEYVRGAWVPGITQSIVKFGKDFIHTLDGLIQAFGVMQRSLGKFISDIDAFGNSFEKMGGLGASAADPGRLYRALLGKGIEPISTGPDMGNSVGRFGANLQMSGDEMAQGGFISKTLEQTRKAMEMAGKVAEKQKIAGMQKESPLKEMFDPMSLLRSRGAFDIKRLAQDLFGIGSDTMRTAGKAFGGAFGIEGMDRKKPSFAPTSALEVGSSDSLSAIIRNMFNRKEDEKELAVLKAIDKGVGAAVKALEKAATTTATSVIESFAG